MKIYPFAIAAGAVLGTAAILVGSGTAANEHQSNTATQQLLINQRISQAAVKRSNQALNYLAPVRTTASDAANTGANGVTGVIEGPVEQNLQKDGVKVRVGLFDEPFFFDLVGFRETRSTGTLSIRNNRNFFDTQNDTAIVLEIPDANLGAGVTNLGVWGQTARFGGNI